ncbi:MAG TPA: glycosyltransferase [Acidimicrobiales bacterium]|nr:glycosyltransferase [Acidimicrobiales bacterium]
MLTAALIVRDEEAVLDECLASIHEVVDEIVVVDTGSVDATCETALRYGARLFRHRWNDDFAEARNVALDHAVGQWVLYIDADERLVDPDRQRVEALLAGSDAAAFRIRLHPELRASAYVEYRIWRNDPTIRFQGIIHESVVPAIERLAKRERRPIRTADLVLRHVGYEGDQRRKHLRNLPLLRRELQRNPTNLFVRHHLFRVLHGLGHEEEADAVLLEALWLVDAGERSGSIDELGALILGEAIRRRGASGEDTGELLAHGLQLYPENCAFLVLEARRLMAQQRYEPAIELVERVLEIAGRAEPSIVAYDMRLLGETPHEIKALCLFRLGRYAEAATEYAKASELAPENASYRVKRDLAAAMAVESPPS